MENKDDNQKLIADNTSYFSDLSKLKIGQNFAETVGVKKAILHVPVRKPNRHEFIRVHPDEKMRLAAAVIELKDDQGTEIFLVPSQFAQELPDEVKPKLLVTAINRQNVLFLWPVSLDLEEGPIRKNHWNETARMAAELAEKKWLRVIPKMSLGAYEAQEASASWPEPEWPDLPFNKILEIAFKNNLITSPDHIVIRKLLGAE